MSQIFNIKTLKRDVYQFDTNIDSIGMVQVEALVIMDIGSYWEPPVFETEINKVTQNGIDISSMLNDFQFERLETLANWARDEETQNEKTKF